LLVKTNVQGYSVSGAHEKFKPIAYELRDLGPEDVRIKIAFCGVCHSDVHQARDEWGGAVFPLVPGHEIVGEVEAVGSKVTKVHVGESVGVGCMVDSCGECEYCLSGEEQFCKKGTTFTYNTRLPDGSTTKGGYATGIVVKEHFVLKLPGGLDLAKTAPLLCAGITTYSPLHHWKVGKGQKIGIVGLGGLGHMALKLAHAMGAHVVQFTTSLKKREDARRLGADEVVLSHDEGAMAAQAGTFDFILDTVSAPHDLNQYLELLRRNGTMTLVGVPPVPPTIEIGNLIYRRGSLAGSLIGGIAETQEMLDFCGRHGITSEIEMISMQQIDTAFDRMVKSDVKYRFVIDLASLEE
jgi:uncharacterized zinc-type alcohol dehydrogenase-like protein